MNINTKIGRKSLLSIKARSETLSPDKLYGSSPLSAVSKFSLDTYENSKKNLFSDNVSITSKESYDEMLTEYEMDYLNLLPNSKILKKCPYWISKALKKKFLWYRRILQYLRDPENGACFKDIKKIFDILPECSSGNEIFLSFRKMNPLLGELEAMRILQNLVDYGYLIPLAKEKTIFLDDSSLYTYQVPIFLYPCIWELDDADYLNFLNRQQSFFTPEDAAEISSRISALLKIVSNPVDIVNQQYKIQE